MIKPQEVGEGFLASSLAEEIVDPMNDWKQLTADIARGTADYKKYL